MQQLKVGNEVMVWRPSDGKRYPAQIRKVSKDWVDLYYVGFENFLDIGYEGGLIEQTYSLAELLPRLAAADVCGKLVMA